MAIAGNVSSAVIAFIRMKLTKTQSHSGSRRTWRATASQRTMSTIHLDFQHDDDAQAGYLEDAAVSQQVLVVNREAALVIKYNASDHQKT